MENTSRKVIISAIDLNESGSDILRLLNKRLDSFIDWTLSNYNYSAELDIVDVWMAYERAHPRFPSRKLREKILIKHNSTYQACGAIDSNCIDHIYPYSLGGKTIEENLQVLCKSCNSKKKDRIG